MASSNVDPPGFPVALLWQRLVSPTAVHKCRIHAFAQALLAFWKPRVNSEPILAPAARIAASTRTPSCPKPIWQAGMDGLWKDCSDDLQFALEEQYQANRTVWGYMFTTKSGFRVCFYHNMAKMRQTNLSDGVVKKLRRIDSKAILSDK